jgi:hypothetical protein
MNRILPLAALALSMFSLANCTKPEPVVERHYYHTNTRYVARPSTTTVTTYSKPAGVSSNSPEAFQAVTPPASYSR